MSYALYFTIWCVAILIGGAAAVMFIEAGKVAASLRCARCGGGWACWHIRDPSLLLYCRRCRPRRAVFGAPVE